MVSQLLKDKLINYWRLAVGYLATGYNLQRTIAFTSESAGETQTCEKSGNPRHSLNTKCCFRFLANRETTNAIMFFTILLLRPMPVPGQFARPQVPEILDKYLDQAWSGSYVSLVAHQIPTQNHRLDPG